MREFKLYIQTTQTEVAYIDAESPEAAVELFYRDGVKTMVDSIEECTPVGIYERKEPNPNLGFEFVSGITGGNYLEHLGIVVNDTPKEPDGANK